ncbi:uncharacterized protein LOC111993963 [Quercus suber]|uniref:uncharacterized protein LOC111993963 n=1 Tax=Quercus suber TaxID=58331 RepID=UPI0032DEBC0C
MTTDDVNSETARIERTKLYLAALKGDWKSVENMQEIQRKITKAEETTLHVAAVANKEDFVRNLVSNGMSSDDLKVENIAGNTALSYAAATGNVNIAKVMVEKNKDLANLGSGVKPIFMAASLGHSQMVQFLYSETNEMVCQWDENEQAELFITCVKGGLYGLKLKEEKSKQSQAHELLKQCLQAYKDDIENLNEISELSLVLFIAAEVGNVEFLVELIHFDLDLLWKIDDKKRSIFHIAVEKRHESIFNLLVVGSIRDLLADRINEDGNNMLHLAAGLAPEEKLNAISGAALQMQRELLWFKVFSHMI